MQGEIPIPRREKTMAQIFTRDRILQIVNAMAEANDVTFDLTEKSLEDLAKQTVAAAKVIEAFLEPDV